MNHGVFCVDFSFFAGIIVFVHSQNPILMIDFFVSDLKAYLPMVLILGASVVLYVFFFFFNHAMLFGFLFKGMKPSLLTASVEMLSSKLGGLLWLGIVPLIVFGWIYPVMDVSWFGLSSAGVTGLWVVILVPVAILINSFATRKQSTLDQYPQVREKIWTNRLLVVDLLCWALYLLGYESFFRGVLLFGLLPFLSPWAVIMINVMAYSFTHIPKGSSEAFGAIFLGTLLCLISLTTGNFWAAFFAHLALAWSNELFSLKNQPGMKFQRAKS